MHVGQQRAQKARMTTNQQAQDQASIEASQRRQVMAVLVLGVIGITTMSLVSNVLWMNQAKFASKFMLFFDVDQEKSLATWWSVSTLAGLGVLTWFVGQRRTMASFGERLGWWMLAFGFLFLSVDEGCMLHERIGGKTELGVDTPLEYARWIFVWLPIMGLFGGFIFWKMWRGSRKTVIGLTVGAVVFLGGAVGTEIINSSNRYAADTSTQERLALEANDFEETQPLEFTGKENYAYVAGTAIEEFLEMFGVVIWFWVIFRAREEVTAAATAGAPLPELKSGAAQPAVSAVASELDGSKEDTVSSSQ